MSDVLRCEDCGLPYRELGLDIVLPDQQWTEIHPEGFGGVLCANCIAKRARKAGATVLLCWLDNVEYGKYEKNNEVKCECKE